MPIQVLPVSQAISVYGYGSGKLMQYNIYEANKRVSISSENIVLYHLKTMPTSNTFEIHIVHANILCILPWLVVIGILQGIFVLQRNQSSESHF